MRSICLTCFATSIDQASRGLPCNGLMFFPGIDLLPPRAGTTAMTRFPFSMIVVVLDSSFDCGARREYAKMIDRFSVFCPLSRVDPGILANWKDADTTAGVLD